MPLNSSFGNIYIRSKHSFLQTNINTKAVFKGNNIGKSDYRKFRFQSMYFRIFWYLHNFKVQIFSLANQTKRWVSQIFQIHALRSMCSNHQLQHSFNNKNIAVLFDNGIDKYCVTNLSNDNNKD